MWLGAGGGRLADIAVAKMWGDRMASHTGAVGIDCSIAASTDGCEGEGDMSMSSRSVAVAKTTDMARLAAAAAAAEGVVAG
jgi:hypothetical protein